LGEALGKSQGLDDNLAKPEGVFLFRYEPNAVVRALDQPIPTAAGGDVSPVAYRFNLRDGRTYLLAQEFPVRDKGCDLRPRRPSRADLQILHLAQHRYRTVHHRYCHLPLREMLTRQELQS
jgi:hypothetical protein